MKTTLVPEMVNPILAHLAQANATHDKCFPGHPAERQPVHTVYGGAHLFKPQIATLLGSRALELIESHAPGPAELAGVLGIDEKSGIAERVFNRVIAKLKNEPLEDYRIDFEDGYGNRPDAEEDAHAVSTAEAVAAGFGQPGFPPFVGIRIKPFTEILHERAIRTLDLFLTTLISRSSPVPKSFVVTLPKVTVPAQVEALVRLLSMLESSHGMRAGSLRMELMIETPESIFDSSGNSAIPALLDAAEGRCRGLHFGVYDYTASLDITAQHQSIVHPACDFARSVLQVSSAGRGVTLSDGATNIMPVGKDPQVVRRAMRLHFEHVQRSLMHGFYQGWDLHPGQLPTRFAAVYAFFLESFAPAAERLSNFVARAAQATLVGDVFDDAATGQGLLNFFLRGINCGAFTEQEACSTGLTLEELRGRSFVKILDNRRGRV